MIKEFEKHNGNWDLLLYLHQKVRILELVGLGMEISEIVSGRLMRES